MLALASSSRGRERVQRVLRSQRADGVMLLALRGDDPLYRLTEQLDLPTVVGGRPPANTKTLIRRRSTRKS